MKKKFLAVVIWMMWSAVSCRKLTDEENFLRVRDCGTVHLPTPNSDSLKVPDDSWLIEVSSEGRSSRTSFGSFISPYHILTSSQPVIDTNYGFDWSGGVNIKCLDNENLELPNEIKKKALSLLKLSTMRCIECVEELLVIGCRPLREKRHAPMILTLKDPVTDRVFPCLAHNDTRVEVGDLVDAYSLSYANKEKYGIEKPDHLHKRLKVTGTAGQFLNTEVNPQQRYGGYGGPLVKIVDGKSTLIGVSNIKNKKEKKKMFLDLRQYEPLLCEKFGICQKTVAPTTTAPPTLQPTYPTINRFDKDGTIWEEKEEEIRQEFDGQFKDIEQGEVVNYSDGEDDIDFGFEGDQKRYRQETRNSGSMYLIWNCLIVLTFWF